MAVILAIFYLVCDPVVLLSRCQLFILGGSFWSPLRCDQDNFNRPCWSVSHFPSLTCLAEKFVTEFIPELFGPGCLVAFESKGFWICYLVLLVHETGQSYLAASVDANSYRPL